MLKGSTPKDIKVTDKRIFTPEGEIREEFRDQIQPSDVAAPSDPAGQQTQPPPPEASPEAPGIPPDDRRTIANRAESPATPFTEFIEGLVAQAYMSLGMLRNPYQPHSPVDPVAARQMIDIINLLHVKTKGNLTPEEEDFLETHLGELKLAFVQRTKSL